MWGLAGSGWLSRRWRSTGLLVLSVTLLFAASFAGSARAAGNSLGIQPPTNAKVGKGYSFTVSGVAASSERLYLFDDIDSCGPSPHVEHAVHDANGGEYVVSGSFTKTSGGWRSPKATTYHICAYLASSSAPYYPTSRYLLARTGKSFKVSRSAPSGSLPHLVVGSWSGIKPATIDFSGDAGNVVTEHRLVILDGHASGRARNEQYPGLYSGLRQWERNSGPDHDHAVEPTKRPLHPDHRDPQRHDVHRDLRLGCVAVERVLAAHAQKHRGVGHVAVPGARSTSSWDALRLDEGCRVGSACDNR